MTDREQCFLVWRELVARDGDWATFVQDVPQCPATYSAAKEVQKRKVPIKTSLNAQGFIRWRKAQPSDRYTWRDHPCDVSYALRGRVKEYIVQGTDRDISKGHNFGVQCLYGKDGTLFLTGSHSGSADRESPGPGFYRHMKWDVWWFHLGVQLDKEDFDGKHSMDYRKLHPIAGTAPAKKPPQQQKPKQGGTQP